MMLGKMTMAPVVVLALIGMALMGPISGATAAAQTFIEGSEDLPLAPMLTPVEEGSVIFDSPSGRIVEAIAYGSTSRDIVRDFYAKTLPELGWESTDQTHYHRDGERLVIDFFGNDGALNVRFTLVPE